ncbi:uncharacterized protein [Dermacentor albipictus]|uniref:uncharacterized protein n=1 Tax=Dermacentor albipictus TaxID=60249 RepID=UPI0038FC55BB
MAIITFGGSSFLDFPGWIMSSSDFWVLSAAISLVISASTLVELLADRFTARPLVQRVLPPSATGPRYLPPTCHHPEWVLEQINALCCEPIRVHELKAALGPSKRRSAPGADAITFQMLRNLQDAEQDRLLEYFNTIWSTEALPDSWLTAVVAPVLKPRKPAAAPSSYRPVSLTSAACKVMERIVLARMEWITAQVHYFPEQQTGFRRHRCTADSIADVAATLEDAKNSGDVAVLVLLDVQSAFDSLPHEVIEGSLDNLGITGSLRRFVSAFLVGRTFRVRVGQALSTPRVITTGVAQGSVLSPFLFNAALAGLPSALPADTRYHTQCSIYADDVALWVRGPRQCLPAVRRSLQGALDAVTTFLGSIGLTVSPAKTEALLIRPRAASRLSVHQKAQLEVLHRTAIRNVLGLPRHSNIAAALAEADEWPLSLLMLQRGLGHIDRLHRAPDGQALLDQLRSLPASRMGNLCRLYEETVPQLPVAVAFPPPHHVPPDVHLSLRGLAKRRAPAAALQQAAACKLQEELEGHLLVFTDGSVLSSGSAAAACTVPTLACHRQSGGGWCDSKPALQALVNPRRAGLTVVLLLAKLTALATAGIPISFHWLPSHVGVAGNEGADTCAKAAHHDVVPVTRAVAASDYTRHRLRCLLTSIHPDPRVASGNAPKPLPENGLSKRDRSTLLRSRTGCTWTAARLYAKGRATSPACKRCGDPETLEHLLYACPSLAQERSTVINTYRRHGLPAATQTDLLFPNAAPGREELSTSHHCCPGGRVGTTADLQESTSAYQDRHARLLTYLLERHLSSGGVTRRAPPAPAERPIVSGASSTTSASCRAVGRPP